MSFKIVRNDIVNMNTEAIVNTANDHATVGSGCDHAVYTAAGYDEFGTQLNYQVLSETVSAVRKAKSAAEMDEAIMCCSAPIRADYEKRHKKNRRK